MAGGITPEKTKGWLNVLWPLAERAGPVLTLVLALLLVATCWYGLGVLRECVQHNRALNEKLLAQQAAFYHEFRLALAHCEKQP